MENLVKVIDKTGAIEPDSTFDKIVGFLGKAATELDLAESTDKDGKPVYNIAEGLIYHVNPETKTRFKALVTGFGKVFHSDDARISGRGRDAKVWDTVEVQRHIGDVLHEYPGLTKSLQLMEVCKRYNASRDLMAGIDPAFVQRMVKETKLTWIKRSSVTEPVVTV